MDPIRSRWKQGTEDNQTYHEWRMTHPGVRRALDVPHQREWKPMAHMAVRSRNCKATEQLTLMVKGLTDLLKETLTWKWYQASVRMKDSNFFFLKLLRLFKDISSRPQSVQARHNSLRIVLNQGRWLNRLHRSRLTLLSLPLQPGGYK